MTEIAPESEMDKPRVWACEHQGCGEVLYADSAGWMLRVIRDHYDRAHFIYLDLSMIADIRNSLLRRAKVVL